MLPGSTGSNLTIQNYKRQIYAALYNRMRFLPKSDKVMEKIFNALILRRMGRVVTQTISSTGDGTGFDFSDLTPTAITVSPNWIIAAAAMPDSMKRRGGEEIDAASVKTLNDSLAAGLETYALTVVQAATTTPIGNATYDIEPVGLRGALQALNVNSHGNADAGDSNVLLSATQIGASLNIPEINQAQQRGDGTSPLVTGRISNGYGFNFDFTTLVANDASGYWGVAWKKAAVVYGYNQEPGPERQRYLKQERFMADAEIGVKILYNEMLQPILTQ
jgi:hypothetical protein